jgi:secreted trypsin-like serine protease
MRRLVVLLAVVLGMLATALPAGAITGNWVEDNEHPFVGLVVFYGEDGDDAGEDPDFLHRCSGSLLSPTVFLTAGHCTDEATGATTARVYFQQDAGANYDPETELDLISGYPEYCAAGTLGTLCATSDELYDYGFDDFASYPDTHDVGLVILDQPIALPEYGSLAEEGFLDELAAQSKRRAITFTASGYGLTESNPVHVTSFRKRLMAQSRLTNLKSHNTDGFNLQTNGNGGDRGGTCSGDSGGPVFYGGFESNTIVAVTSFGMNAWCRGVDFSYRTDTEDVQEWILEIIGKEKFDEIEIVRL